MVPFNSNRTSKAAHVKMIKHFKSRHLNCLNNSVRTYKHHKSLAQSALRLPGLFWPSAGGVGFPNPDWVTPGDLGRECLP